MTVEVNDGRIIYDGDGTTVAFATDFPFLTNADLKVYLVEIATGTATAQVLDTDYTLTGAGEASGTATFTTAPENTHKVLLYNDPAASQGTDLTTGNPLPADTIEGMVDRNTLGLAAVREAVLRAVRIPLTDISGIDMELPAPPVADGLLSVDAAGTGLKYVAVGDLGDVALPAGEANKVVAWDGDGDDLANLTQKSIAETDRVPNMLRSDDYADLDAALTAASSNVRTLVISSSFSAPNNATIPSTLTLMFVGEGQLSVASAKTVTINGPVQAPFKQIFAGSGTVTFGVGLVGALHPHWWGAAFDGATDDTTALQAVLTEAATNGHLLELPPGTALFSAKLTATVPANDLLGFALVGAGRGRTILKYTGAAAIGDALDISVAGSANEWGLNVRVEGIKIDLTGAPANTNGLRIEDGIWRSGFDDIYVVRDAETPRTGYGIYIGSPTAGKAGCFDLKFSRLYVNNFANAVRAVGTDASGNTITNLVIADSYLANCDINLYVDYFNGLTVLGSQLENAVTAGAYLANGETAVFLGGSIESSVAGAKGIDMDANTKSVIALCDFFNNAGGHFLQNGKIGHLYKTGNSGFVYPAGAEMRVDSDGTNHAYVRFFRNGVTDLRFRVADSGNAVIVTDANDVEKFRFSVTGEAFDAGNLRLTDGVTAPGTVAGKAQIYVDTADGDLKVKFGDGTVKTIVTDT